MGNQNKLSRMLQILLYLSGNYGHSRKEIAERFGINERTVYRYLSTFKEAGLVLEEK
ncbi:MAG: helix-turn-helix domain-containing protein, partial [Bacteroidota bacterium]